MAQLKTVNILEEIGGLGDEESAPKKPAATRTKAEKKETAARAGEGKPSPYEADLRAKLRRKRQMSLGPIPEFICDEFDRLCQAAGMNKREYFYHLLRQAGADIPPYDQLDGRKL